MSNRNQFIAALLIILITLIGSLWQAGILQSNKIQAESYKRQASNLSVEKNLLIEEYQNIKTSVSNERSSLSQELNIVFPIDEDLTKLTRLFDDFATKNNFNSNPFFISNINYKAAQSYGEEEYFYVPVSMQLNTSKKNLIKFLEYIENSGSFEGQVRLMSIEDLTVSYPLEYGGTYDVNIELNAYFNAI